MKRAPLGEKALLDQEETIAFFNFSRRKFFQFVKEGKMKKFIVYYGKRKFFLRGEIERYLEMKPDVKEVLKNGKQGWQARKKV